MNLYPLELEANLIQITILVVLIFWRILRFQHIGNVTHHLFMCSIISHLTLNIYWTAALVLSMDQANLMFKASDTGAIAMFLFWFSTIQSKCRVDLRTNVAWHPVPITAFIFSLWNVVWWNLWNLNLFTNTLWAICVSLFFYAVFYALDSLNALRKRIVIPMAVAVLALFVFEIPMYFYESDTVVYILSDWICFVAWALLIALSFISAFMDKKHRTLWLFSCQMLSMFAEYLSDGIRYSLFMIIESIILVALIVCFNEKDFEEVAV